MVFRGTQAGLPVMTATRTGIVVVEKTANCHREAVTVIQAVGVERRQITGRFQIPQVVETQGAVWKYAVAGIESPQKPEWNR